MYTNTAVIFARNLSSCHLHRSITKDNIFFAYYVAMIFAFFWLIIAPISSISEDQFDSSVQILTYDEIQSKNTQVKTWLQNPTANGIDRYFDIVYTYDEVKSHCVARFELDKKDRGFISARESEMDAGNPCFQVRNIQIQVDWFITDYQQSLIDESKISSARRSFYQRYPNHTGITSARPQLYKTVWHFEKITTAYENGLFLFFVFFVIRIYRKKCHLYWEMVTFRLPFMVLCWPVVFWFYPSNPIDQLKEIRRWCGYILSATLSCFTVGAKAFERELKVSGNVGFSSSYILDTGFVPDTKWVVQSSLTTQHIPTGLYASAWSSFGLEQATGNEIDFTAGWKHAVENWSIDISYNYFWLLSADFGLHTPKAVVCRNDTFTFCGKVMYTIPDNGNDPKLQLGIWGQTSWTEYRISTTLGIMHTTSLTTNSAITILKGEVSIPIGEQLRLFVKGIIPLAGDIDPVGLVGIQYSF